jgi:antitoxin (DNA-binding transcriptional repressor) of toxin-antitoxin stability system
VAPPAKDRPNTVSVAEDRARFSELLDAVEAGETVTITRRGEPVAVLSAHRRPRKRIDVAWLREQTATTAYSDTDSGDLVRKMRDGNRYRESPSSRSTGSGARSVTSPSLDRLATDRVPRRS